MKKILIVVDYQHDFVNGVLAIPQADLIANNIQNQINDKNFDEIIYTFDTHTLQDYETSEEKKLFPFIHCQYKTKGWNFFDIKPRNNEIFQNTLQNLDEPFDFIDINNEEFFFCKDKFDIWQGNTIYENWFTQKYNKNEFEFFITGVATEYCVNMNIVGLIERGYKVNIIQNCIKAINDIDGTNTLNNYENKVNII